MEVIVVDVGATGVTPQDRVTDVAAILLDAGLVEQHSYLFGVRSGCFCKSAGTLSTWVTGRLLAAYNLPFDQRMLESEYKHCGYAFDAGQGVDIQLEDVSLAEACEREGITLSGSGSMNEAAAAAELLRRQVRKGLRSLTGTPARFV